MSINISYDLVCTDCSKQFRDGNHQAQFESEQELKESVIGYGWKFKVRVENGSDWDFCPECWSSHKDK